MAVKPAGTRTKKAAPKKAVPAKKTTAAVKKATPKKKTRVGSAYECRVCGLAVSVIDDCGCIDTCDLICCEQPMKPRKTKVA